MTNNNILNSAKNQNSELCDDFNSACARLWPLNAMYSHVALRIDGCLCPAVVLP